MLLQPRPQIEDTIPNVNDLPNRHFGHVGLIDQSLFAITPRTFPLVAFDNSRADSESEYTSVDQVTERRKLEALCEKGGTDRRCLVGLRHLEDSSSWNRLLDGPSAPGIREQMEQIEQTADTTIVDNSSINSTTWWPINGTAPADLVADPKPTLILSSFMAFFVGAIWLYKKFAATTSSTLESPVAVRAPEKPTHPLETALPISELVKPANALETHANGHTLSAPTSETIINGDPQPITVVPLIENGDLNVKPDLVDDAADGDDSDRDDDNTPGRPKGKKKRRGKKKKAIPVLDSEVPDGVDEKEKDKGRPDGSPQTPLAALVPAPATPTLILPETPRSTTIASQLIVSDTVLGENHSTVCHVF